MTEKITLEDLRAKKNSSEKITSLTAYDAAFARILDESDIDIQLVGDSLGMVLHGEKDTLSVSMDDMIYHTRMVAKTVKKSLVVVDMPYESYEKPQQALDNANRFINEAGADVVKIEGGDELIIEIIVYIISYALYIT